MKRRVRNSDRARNTFVTKRAETKLDALTDLFKAAAGEHWVETQSGVLRRKLLFTGFHYLNSLWFIYNWENRFMSVNYNLHITSEFSADSDRYEATNDCVFTLVCTEDGFAGKRKYLWKCTRWEEDEAKMNAYVERLTHPYILDRLNSLDIMEMEIRHQDSWNFWRVSCESMIGSATWILIPPVVSMITPKPDECVRFMELYELLGDAVVNNK